MHVFRDLRRNTGRYIIFRDEKEILSPKIPA